MSSKSTSENPGKNFFNTSGNGQVLMNSGHHTTVKSKVDFIYGAVPSRSKDDILLVLQSCDYNVDAAISAFSQGQAEGILSQWSHKGKRPKNVNKKKLNKKKQDVAKVCTADVKEDENTKEVELTSRDTESNIVQNLHESENGENVAFALDLALSNNLHTPPPAAVNGLSPISSSSSNSSFPNNPSGGSTKQHHVTAHHRTNKHHHAKVEKLSPTSGADALKKTSKDLSRSSFSLARYQVVLEEECEQSFKRMNKTFENIRNCLKEREATLNKAMNELKEEADKLLQQRLEDASALKLKTERANGMSDEQIAFLRADIKSFVAERKIDEEMAQTKRFVCDESNFLQEIKTFGEIVPIKNTYTPVVLNHPTTAPDTQSTKKSSQLSKPIASATKQSTTSKTSTAGKNISLKETAHDTRHHVNEPVIPSVIHANVNASGPPPRIEALISSAIAKSSLAASESLHDSAEVHLKLMEVLKQQGVSRVYDQGKGSKTQPKDHSISGEQKQQRSRPNTAPQPPGKQQHQQKQRQDQRSQRPQSSRTGNRAQAQGDQKLDKMNEGNTTTQPNDRTRTNQRAHPRQAEKGKQRSGHESLVSDSQSVQQEGGRGRSQRDRRRGGGRDRNSRVNNEAVASDVSVASQEKHEENMKRDMKNQVQLVTKRGNTAQEGGVATADSNASNTDSKDEPAAEDGLLESALPQRANKAPNRRRNRGRDRNIKDHKDESLHVNGANNGLDRQPSDVEDEKELSDKIKENEEKITKVTAVEADPVLIGHNGTCEITEDQTAIQAEKPVLNHQPSDVEDKKELSDKINEKEEKITKVTAVEVDPVFIGTCEITEDHTAIQAEKPGLNHQPSDAEDKKELPDKINEKEEKITKVTAVEVDPVFIGTCEITEDHTAIQAEKPVEDRPEINSCVTTNGVGDDCLVER